MLAYLALGLPVWWYTTRIQRPALPHARMQQAPSEVEAFQLPVSITLYIQAEGQGTDLAAVAEHFGAELFEASAGPGMVDDLTVAVIARSANGQRCLSSWLQLPEPIEAPGGSSHSGSAEGRSVALCQSPEFQALLAALDGLGPSELDDAWDALLQRHGLAAPGSYHVLVLATEAAAGAAEQQQQAPVKLQLGQHRGAVLRVPRAEDGEQAQRQQRLLQALTAASAAIAHAFMSSSGSITAGQQPLSAAGEALLSFSLCNADPDQQYSTWRDFAAFQRRYLDPVIAAVRPAMHLTVESQVLLHASSAQRGSWSEEHAAFVLKQGKLRHFVDSSWNLNTGAMAMAAAGEAAEPNATAAAPRRATAARGAKPLLAHSAEASIPKHVLQFVAYVPARAQQPLLLLLPEERPSPTNSFHIPAWGGVQVINPEPSDGRVRCESRVPGLCAASAAAQPLSDGEMARFAVVVVSQLRALLGVGPSGAALQPGRGPRLELQVLPALQAGVRAWEADALLRQRAAHNAATAARVLSSLSRLVEQLPTLEMPDLIGEQVEEALQFLVKAITAMQEGDHTGACTAAQAASSYAEAAFSNPAVLAQLSFPPSHLIGVYLPFFAPLAMALVQALYTEVGHFKKNLPKAEAS